jgi:hypothetical protein
MKIPFNLNGKQSKAALVLGALTVSTALGMAGTAQAAPPSYAPAWGYRDRDDVRYDRRDRWDRRDRDDRGPRRGRDRDDSRSFTGVVTRYRGDNLFDMRIGGTTYNVYTINRLPRRLDDGDVVRVTGRRVGSNDIRDARVTVVRNR